MLFHFVGLVSVVADFIKLCRSVLISLKCIAQNKLISLCSRLSSSVSLSSLLRRLVVDAWLVHGILNTARAALLCDASSLSLNVFGRGSQEHDVYSSN